MHTYSDHVLTSEASHFGHMQTTRSHSAVSETGQRVQLQTLMSHQVYGHQPHDMTQASC